MIVRRNTKTGGDDDDDDDGDGAGRGGDLRQLSQSGTVHKPQSSKGK